MVRWWPHQVRGRSRGALRFLFRRPHVIAPDLLSTKPRTSYLEAPIYERASASPFRLISLQLSALRIDTHLGAQDPKTQPTPLLASCRSFPTPIASTQNLALPIHTPLHALIFTPRIDSSSLKTCSPVRRASTSHCTTYTVRTCPTWRRQTSPRPSRARSAESVS